MMGRRGSSVNVAYEEQSVGGLNLRAFENGFLGITCEIGGEKFECMLDERYVVYAATMPSATAWALREDIEESSLDVALAKLPKRLKAYVLRQKQVENTERKYSPHLLGRKLQTAGSYNFIRVDLVLNFEDYGGVLRLDMWYDDFSVHPDSTVVKCRGPPDFTDLVAEKIEAIQDLLQTMPLDDVCGLLCETE